MGGRAVRWIVIAVVAVVVLFVAADRIGLYAAERAAADTLQTSQHLPSRPGVDIAGFPFLTQVIAGKYDKITVTAKDVPVGRPSHLLTISRLRVVLHTLTVSRTFHTFRANTAAATAEITFGELGKTLGLQLSYAGDGRIRAGKTLTVAGVSVHASLTTKPQLVNGTLAFTQTTIDNAGALSRGAAAELAHAVDLAIPLQGIPFNVHVRSLTVGSDGIAIALTGRDLTYAR